MQVICVCAVAYVNVFNILQFSYCVVVENRYVLAWRASYCYSGGHCCGLSFPSSSRIAARRRLFRDVYLRARRKQMETKMKIMKM